MSAIFGHAASKSADNTGGRWQLDSSLSARQELVRELHYTADTKDSAAMNTWLHKQVIIKLAENSGKVPAELKN